MEDNHLLVILNNILDVTDLTEGKTKGIMCYTSYITLM